MDADDDMDSAMLREALAASLREHNSNHSPRSDAKPRKNVVDLTRESETESEVEEIHPKSKPTVGSDTEDEAGEDEEELKRAIALSLQHSQPSPQVMEKQADPPQQAIETSKPQGILGLDRKQMEQERLARLAKRKAVSSDSPPGCSPAKVAKVDKPEGSQASKLDVPLSSQLLSPTPTKVSTPQICDRPTANDPSFKVQPSARPVPQWPLGAVKKTCISNRPREGDDITIEEVVQRGDVELAVLSSFLWDMEWVFHKFDMQSTRLYLIMHAKEESTRAQYRNETREMRSIRLCFPPMDGQVNCMHSKLMLLFRSDSLRLVVPSANLTPHDWGESNLMESTVFIMDLPQKTLESSGNDSKTAFYDDLVHFLKASDLHDNIIAKLDNFDFSKTARYAFVHTIGGSHPDKDAWSRTGYSGLGRAVSNLGLQARSPISVDYVASSVGSLTDEFVRAIYLACKGDDGLMDYDLRNTKSPSQAQSIARLNQEWQDRFRVYFPSDDTVQSAHLYPEETAGTICFQEKWWRGPKFPRHVMRDCESTRGVLMHNKLIFVTPSKPIAWDNDTECQGWAYVGSANFSESAWGRLVKDRTTGQPKLNCRNWECGVLVPVTRPRKQNQIGDATESDADKEGSATSQTSGLAADVFQTTVPVPMKLPPAQLDARRGPWFY
ncbi:hypothetical protein N7492_003458 [Penicillium capsulatum]|uniref:PLD phosphodiesterase domain-containing protein n=1 Tax=Penicillium capsulatum TaxID=69766 RepID=A0A9W9LW89_9EURO|nr:hypothetical protein N7492_003458 [Penicillium capsulatum]KAJ6121959.1 hypothetical protein N7512_004424 [Penicillium capsulatum]